MCLIVTGTVAMSAAARGVSPYLPLNLSPEIERQIERVLILGDKPVLKRPIAAAVVLDALPKACKADPVLCASVRRYLDHYMGRYGVTHASVEAGVARNSNATLPNQHGMPADSSWQASATGFYQPGDYALLSVGAEAYEGDVTPTGSFLSLGFEYAQLDAGYRDHWFSPLTDSAMLISTEASTMPSLSLSNYQPISRLGLQYELFLAAMSHSDGITNGDAVTSGRPRLAGFHLSLEPASGWSLGVNRLMQFGGGSRGGNSISQIAKAFFNPSAHDNTNATLNTQQESGNQQAAFTSEFIFPGKTPFSVYFEYAGEDTFHAQNYRLGNTGLSAGIHFPRLWHRFDVTYEISEWQNLWYTHHIYPEGMTNDGHVLGHWGGDDRVFGNAVGAQSQMLRVGWDATFGGAFDVRYRTLQNKNYYGVHYDRAHEFTLAYSRPWHDFTVGAQIDGGRDAFGDSFGRLSAFLRYVGNTDTSRVAAVDEIPDGEETSGTERFVDLGLGYFNVGFNVSDGVNPQVTSTSTGAHLGIGARRAVSDHSDLGVRLEIDDVKGRSLISLRALDYRYRIGRDYAASLFLGAARYDAPTPAQGYYAGAGLQRRNIFPHWDVALDFRYYDRLQRDKVLPGESQNSWPDAWYTMTGGTLSLSRRF